MWIISGRGKSDNRHDPKHPKSIEPANNRLQTAGMLCADERRRNDQEECAA